MDSFGAVCGSKLNEQGAGVGLDGAFGNIQLVCNFLVGVTLCDQLDDVEFPEREKKRKWGQVNSLQ